MVCRVVLIVTGCKHALHDRGGAPSIREWVIFLQIRRDQRVWERKALEQTTLQSYRARYIAMRSVDCGYHSFFHPGSSWHERNDNEVYQEVYL